MRGVLLIPVVLCVLIVRPVAGQTPEGPAAEVRAAETAFAGTMAERDLESFLSFVSDEAVFIGRGSTLRGREAIEEGWASFFDGPEAPFSWTPEQVEVLDSGTLALSSGPVRNPAGRVIGTFNSIWRKEADGSWRVVFDKGCPVCDPAPGHTDPARSGLR